MNAQVVDEDLSVPDHDDGFHYATGFAVEEIVLGVGVLTTKVRALKSSNAIASAVAQKFAAEDVSKIAGQIKMMADMLARVTINHLNRKPR